MLYVIRFNMVKICGFVRSVKVHEKTASYKKILKTYVGLLWKNIIKIIILYRLLYKQCLRPYCK